MFRRTVVCLLFTVFLPTVAEAQPKISRIGYLSNLSRDSQVARFESFRQGLRDLGHIEGQNIFIEARYARAVSTSCQLFPPSSSSSRSTS
jgi:putative ABC transport system substrate-binding protein